MELNWKKVVLSGIIAPFVFLLTFVILLIPGLMTYLDVRAPAWVIFTVIGLYTLIFLVLLIVPAIYFGRKLKWYFGLIYAGVFIVFLIIFVSIWVLLDCYLGYFHLICSSPTSSPMY